MVDALNTEEKSELKTENEIAPVLNASDTLNQQSSVLRFFNLYQSGDYVLSQQKSGDADLVVEITEQYKNGYLLQCYDNGHVNKFDVSTLFTKRDWSVNTIAYLDIFLFEPVHLSPRTPNV